MRRVGRLQAECLRLREPLPLLLHPLLPLLMPQRQQQVWLSLSSCRTPLHFSGPLSPQSQ